MSRNHHTWGPLCIGLGVRAEQVPQRSKKRPTIRKNLLRGRWTEGINQKRFELMMSNHHARSINVRKRKEISRLSRKLEKDGGGRRPQCLSCAGGNALRESICVFGKVSRSSNGNRNSLLQRKRESLAGEIRGHQLKGGYSMRILGHDGFGPRLVEGREDSAYTWSTGHANYGSREQHKGTVNRNHLYIALMAQNATHRGAQKIIRA